LAPLRSPAAALVGRRLVAVRYFEYLDEWEDGPQWPGEDFDSLDYGLELRHDGGGTCSFVWNQRGPVEEVEAVDGPLIPGVLRPDRTRVDDVTHESGWPAFVGREITATEAVREHVWDPPRMDEPCVVTYVLGFGADEHVVITLGRRADDGRWQYTHDKVAVFFSLATARRHDVPLPDGA
jgi:hypothetical protein